MSRVWKGQKYLNIVHSKNFNGGPSKMVRIHFPAEDYYNASSLYSWLFIKYGMTYKTFRGKSKARRDALRKEYMVDTGNTHPDKRRRQLCTRN